LVRVLVTGGAGFIGANLCARLTGDAGIDSVVAFDDLSSGSITNLDGSRAELLEGTVLDRDAVMAAVGPADVVVHLAARVSVEQSAADPLGTHEVNATGTLNILEAARRSKTRQVIIASSAAVYGDGDGAPAAETAPVAPRSAYGASKVAAEAYASAYHTSFGLGTLALRFFNVFGPLQRPDSGYAAVVPAFVTAAIGRRRVTVHGDGTQTRDFVYVGNVCAVIQDAIARGVSLPGPVNVASGTSVSLNDLLATLERLVGHPLEREFGPSRPGDVHDSRGDTGLLTRLFPEVPTETFDAGLESTLASARATNATVRA
jgi:UDP-glucose 4-epimerase